MRGALLTIAACLALAFAGCGDDDSSTTAGAGEETAPAKPAKPSQEKTKPQVTVPDGAPPKKLVENDVEIGTGAAAKAGDEVTVQYVGVGYDSKEEFDSSWSRSEPFTFNLGAGEVIPGWDQGIQGMKVGGRRELVIPPNLAYGPAGSPPVIGPNETLIFVVDLEAVK
ncbi:MAG TPA: FKBP-type peptidyl-prolyl cis-trans isomerase [Solirubrobacterales bacterium]|nr:FKBP-type peptidyl-prolyl cis-trans isomerase [Solirubrobacterales bacterium]